MKYDEKRVKNYIEKKLDTRKRSNSEFVNSLEIVKDSKKIKNTRCRMGYSPTHEETRNYETNYSNAFGHTGAKGGSTGSYKWDEKQGKFIKVSDYTPSGKLVTL